MEMFHGDEFEPSVEARFEVCELYLPPVYALAVGIITCRAF